MSLILNPVVNIKKTNNRVIIYIIDPSTYIPSTPYVIKSTFAVLFALFDGENSYDQVLQDFIYVMNKEYSEESVKWVEDCIELIRENLGVDSLLVEKDTLDPDEQNPRYNPMDLAISSDEEKSVAEDLRIGFPLTINYNVTTNCKMNCKYCYHPRYKINEYISLERLEILFDECVENGCEMVFLSGGDPIEHPNILGIMKLLHQKGLNYYISTKSYLNQDICTQFKEEAGLQLMQISLDSANPEIAAFLAGMDEGHFQRTIETIENLHAAGVNVRVNAVLTSYNIDHIDDLLRLCAELNVESVDLTLYQRSIWHHFDQLLPTEEQLHSALEKINQFKLDHDQPKIEHSNLTPQVISSHLDQNNIFEHRSVCAAGRFSLTLLPNGEVTVCEYLEHSPDVILGDLREQSITEFWHSEKVLQFLAPPDRTIFSDDTPCKTCADEDYEKCHTIYSRCYKNTLGYFKTIHAPDVLCKLAKVRDYRIS